MPYNLMDAFDWVKETFRFETTFDFLVSLNFAQTRLPRSFKLDLFIE